MELRGVKDPVAGKLMRRRRPLNKRSVMAMIGQAPSTDSNARRSLFVFCIAASETPPSHFYLFRNSAGRYAPIIYYCNIVTYTAQFVS